MKKEHGITLIALIITIIVLVILAGASIYAAIHSGMITAAKEATKDYEKAQIIELVKIEIGRIKASNPYIVFGPEFAQKLEENLEKLHNAEYKDHIITAIWNSQYHLTITETEVSMIELGAFSQVRSNVKAMKEDVSLAEGEVVLTSGYYYGGDNGSGVYRITSNTGQSTDEGRYIQLDNGLIAELLISDSTINVKQYGAYGDGVQDDTKKIQAAFEQLQTGECNTIYFPSGTYIIKEKVAMYSGTYVGNSNATIKIVGRTTGSEYAFYNNKEGQHYSGKADTIVLDSLTVCVKMNKTKDRDHINMFRFFHTVGTQVNNCYFYTEEGNEIGVCPVDLYTDNHQFILENCTSKIYGLEDTLNSHIMVRERYQGNSTSDIVLKNYQGEKSGKDESLWIDAWLGTLENVEITNCKMKDVGISTSMIFLGANAQTSVANNIKMHDCYLIKEQFSNGIFKLAMTEQEQAGIAQNIHVYNNTIEICSNLNGELQPGTAVFQINTPNRANSNSRDIYIENNTVLAEEAKIGTVVRDYSSNYITTTRNNTIKINRFESDPSYFVGVYHGIKEVDSDQLTGTSSNVINCSYLFRNCKLIHGIQASMTGKFINDYHTTASEIEIRDCNVTVNDIAVNIITNSTNLYTINLKNCNITNSGKLAGVWYSDINSSTISGTGIQLIKQNVTAKNSGTSGTITITDM